MKIQPTLEERVKEFESDSEKSTLWKIDGAEVAPNPPIVLQLATGRANPLSLGAGQSAPKPIKRRGIFWSQISWTFNLPPVSWVKIMLLQRYASIDGRGRMSI